MRDEKANRYIWLVVRHAPCGVWPDIWRSPFLRRAASRRPQEEKTFDVAEHSLLKKEPSLLNLSNVGGVSRVMSAFFLLGKPAVFP
jgi:hypothetical protein